jgi:RNA polymerase sigma factor (sigma-70 family)
VGAVKVDLSQKERALDAKYPALDSPENLRILLSDYHALLNRQYQGDYDAVVLLADLQNAVELAKLTERQSEALRLVYEEDLTQEEAGKLMGIAQNSVSEAVDRAVENIAEVYWFWSRHGEGYSVGGADNVKPN